MSTTKALEALDTLCLNKKKLKSYTIKDITNQYKKLMLQNHPDKLIQGCIQLDASKINSAKDVLLEYYESNDDTFNTTDVNITYDYVVKHTLVSCKYCNCLSTFFGKIKDYEIVEVKNHVNQCKVAHKSVKMKPVIINTNDDYWNSMPTSEDIYGKF